MIDKTLFKNGEIVAVALSGGVDSMCLLHDVLSMHDLKITVKAINVEHGIRGETSLKDTEFVKEYCQKVGVELKCYSVDAKGYASENGLSEEESARILRYDCFYKAINSGFCNKVAVAHHLSDNAETVLFNLFRGAGVKGAMGISNEREDGKIIRPFHSVTREEIENYAIQNSVPHVTDETNLIDGYTRNYIRHNIIPRIKERFPDFERSIERFSEISAREDEYLDKLSENALTFKDGEYYLDCNLEDCIFARATVIALKKLGIVKDYEKRHIDEVVELKNAKSGSGVDLPQNVRAVNEYGKIVFYLKGNESLFEEEPYSEGITFFNGYEIEILSEISEGNEKVLRFDGDKIPETAVIRTRQDGDVFKKYGGGTKKLNDYFIDIKIAKRKRDLQLLLADGNEILIIFGVEISDKIKVDADTKNELKCKIVKW